ncbi:Maf family protein [Paenibacillus sacheonensis]|uniref:dTTP/UTP pyrophosphatase n=1 Tax=Paenibacillus sacheonensis TaxID=742054 RepID=A0A7X4YLX7_9BACL|nr:Maf family protein [Paenibacillus sacheonensis]MBM7563779.1 septum formation protein [Paenibacillus sacheonensis]NBC67869.1 septum formation protein Maf [Paenibacillus sacheonensis]
MVQSRSNPTEHLRQLVLASSSPRRRELVASLDLSLPVLILPSDTDEGTPPDWQPSRIVEQLGLRKARATAGLLAPEDRDGSLVIGADTIVVLDGEVLGKPLDREDAIRTLSRLQGRRHQVFTGVACLDPHTGREITAHRKTEVVMKPLDPEVIARYADTGEPLDKAGSYGIQGRGAVLVDRIDGCYFNVVGLPLSLLADMLSEFNIAVI